MRKNTKTTIYIVAAAMILLMAVGFLTSGFQKFSKDDILEKVTPTVNAENYYQSVKFDFVEMRTEEGIFITRNEKTNALTLNGNYYSEDTQPNELKVGTITLDPGTYTFTCSNDSRLGYFYMGLNTGVSKIKADFSGNTFTVDAETDCEVYLYVYPGVDFNNVELEPVIISGSETGDFWK